MNREIKFRAWDKQEKVMLLWDDWSDEIKDAIPHDAGDEWTERCIVMQFTGLHDKNGKEIYEGDVVTHPRAISGVAQIKFMGGGFYPVEKGFSSAYPWTHGIEIIGNIWENPELIK